MSGLWSSVGLVNKLIVIKNKDQQPQTTDQHMLKPPSRVINSASIFLLVLLDS